MRETPAQGRAGASFADRMYSTETPYEATHGALMDAIREQVQELREICDEAFPKVPLAAVSQFLPNTNLSAVTEVIATAAQLLERTRAPNGFSPGFQIAKSLAGVTLPTLLTYAKQVAAGQHNALSGIFSHLIQLLSALHTMAVFSEKDGEPSAALTAELSQAIALMSTGQRELADKLTLLEQTSIVAAEIDAMKVESAALLEQIEGYKEQASQADEGAQSALEQAEKAAASTDELMKKAAQIEASNSALAGNLKEIASEVERMQSAAEKQQSVIESILPKAASAGLAAAFSERGGQLASTKTTWTCLFAIALIGLTLIAWDFAKDGPPAGVLWWQHMLYRLPLTAPLIWLGWFSAIQYGNVVRVQEDYAFKEATSKAFQGYRDHMEHLANVDTEGAETALNLLSTRTIEILAKEPLRIFDRTHSDASPAASSIVDRVTRAMRKGDKGEGKDSDD